MLGAGLPPSAHSAFPSTASLYRTVFKIEAKHNIHRTGTHTHAHRRLPTTAVRQPHSKSTKECIQRLPGGPQTAILPTIALLAARGRKPQALQPCARGREAGTGEGSANLSGDCGAKEAVLEIAEEMIKEKTRLEDPEGQTELGLDP